MGAILVVLFFLALPASAEEIISGYMDDSEISTFIESTTGSLNWAEMVQLDYACIDTEICGDATGDLSVRCVRVRICGEAIR